MISNPWKIFNSPSTNQDNRVLLQIVSHTWNICSDFYPISQPNPCHFPKSRVWFFWSLCVNTNTNSSFLGTSLKCRAFGLTLLLLTSFSHQLVKRGQVVVLLQTKKDAEASSKHKHFTVKQRAVNTKPERIPCQAPVTFHSLTLCGP